MKKYIFLIIVLTTLVYFNSLGNAFVWDDLNNIVNNDSLSGPVKLKDIFLNSPVCKFFTPHTNSNIITGHDTIGVGVYRPISYLTIIFDHRLWGNNPFGYHLTNFLFHLINVILIFYITARLTRSHLISFICSILFAIHPVHTEAITYISGRSDPICGFFIFSAFLFYLKSLERIGHRQSVYFGGALSLFLLGLLSKENAIVFPFVIFAYEYLYLNSQFKLCLKRSMPFFAVLSSFLIFRYVFLGEPMLKIDLNKVFLAPKILIYYIRLLIFPINLHMQHSFEEGGFILKMPPILAAIISIGLFIVLLRYLRKKVIFFGATWFLIGLLPFLGIFKLNSDLAEHWLYLASFGFFLVIGHPLLWRSKIASSIILAFLCILTIQRNFVWRDDMSIYQDTLKYRPNDPKLRYNLGNAYLRNGLLNAAAKEYSIAIEGNPNYAYALNNLGFVLEKQGDTKAAHQYYKMAITSDPKLDAAKNNLLRFQFTPTPKSLVWGFTSLAFAQDSYFDHSLYGEVLKRFVDDGKVDYATLKNNPSTLDKYLKGVAALDNDALNSMLGNEKITFYLNVYNALTLKVIVDYYPLKSIKDIPGVWDRLEFKVAGRELTLNQVEHQILRKEFKDPRIHFALVCASKGCPRLASEPFSGKSLYEQLDREAGKFINDKTKVRLDKSNRTLYISSIFKWFSEDFGDVIKFISKYLPENDAEFIEKTKPKIQYLNYDWSLNEKL